MTSEEIPPPPPDEERFEASDDRPPPPPQQERSEGEWSTSGPRGRNPHQYREPREPREQKRDPQDMGNLPQHLEGVSRELAMVLRHKAYNYGIEVDHENWVKLSELSKVNTLRQVKRDDLETIIQESYSKNRPRFETTEREGVWYVRATHKHSSGESRWSDSRGDRGERNYGRERRRNHRNWDNDETPADGCQSAEPLEIQLGKIEPAAPPEPAGPDPWAKKDPWGGDDGDAWESGHGGCLEPPPPSVSPCSASVQAPAQGPPPVPFSAAPAASSSQGEAKSSESSTGTAAAASQETYSPGSYTWEHGWEAYVDNSTGCDRTWFWRAATGARPEEFFFEDQAQSRSWGMYSSDGIGRWWWNEKTGQCFTDPRGKPRPQDIPVPS